MQYFEDLEIGCKVRQGSYDVTREEMIEFARKYDPQPFHLSDEEAAKTHFGRLSASGWHTCAMVMGIIARYLIKEQLAGLGSPGIDEIRWVRPVFAGDTLHVDSTIIDTRPSRSKPDIGSFRSTVEVTNQNGETVMRYISTVMVRRRPRDQGTNPEAA